MGPVRVHEAKPRLTRWQVPATSAFIVSIFVECKEASDNTTNEILFENVHNSGVLCCDMDK